MRQVEPEVVVALVALVFAAVVFVATLVLDRVS